MKRYIRSESDITKAKKQEMKEVGHALQSAIKSYPEELPKARFIDTETNEVVELTPRILSSVKGVNTEHCFVSVRFNFIIDAYVDDIIEYAIDQVADDYIDYKFKPGKYGGFRGYDVGVWITRV